MSKYESIEPDLSDARLRGYLTRARGDVEDALALYVWNAQLAAALFIDLGHLEVALRNALDERMIARHGDWLDDLTGELGLDVKASIPQATVSGHCLGAEPGDRQS